MRILLALVALLAVGLVACGGDDDSGPDAAPETATEAPETATATVEAETPAPTETQEPTPTLAPSPTPDAVAERVNKALSGIATMNLAGARLALAYLNLQSGTDPASNWTVVEEICPEYPAFGHSLLSEGNLWPSAYEDYDGRIAAICKVYEDDKAANGAPVDSPDWRTHAQASLIYLEEGQAPIEALDYTVEQLETVLRERASGTVR